MDISSDLQPGVSLIHDRTVDHLQPAIETQNIEAFRRGTSCLKLQKMMLKPEELGQGAIS